MTTPTEKAEALNKQFFTFLLRKTIMSLPLNLTLFLILMTYFSTFGISCILEKLHSNKAPGPDEIPVYILKRCNEKIAPVLQIILMQSFKDQNLPSDWLMTNIVPIFKKGNHNLASNYWPISLTSTCCKVI